MQLAAALATAMLLFQPTGLKSIDTIVGSGDPIGAGDIATVTFRASLTTGKLVDATGKKAPLAFRVGAASVIKGLDVGIVGMQVGGKRILSIPPEMAYGDRSTVEIPGGSTLIYELELLRIEKRGGKPVIEIEDLKVGEGREVQRGDTVEVHYTGSFLNGEKFDSSRDRNQTFPVTVGTTRIIKGFEQGLMGMKVGGKRKVVIPHQLGYGEAGVPPVIPPLSTLLFEIEVLSLTPRGR